MNLKRCTTGALLTATLASSLTFAAPAYAGSEGRKNTTVVLGALAVHQLLTGHTNNAILAGAATAVAYDKYRDEKKKEDREKRYERRWDRREWRHHRR